MREIARSIVERRSAHDQMAIVALNGDQMASTSDRKALFERIDRLTAVGNGRAGRCLQETSLAQEGTARRVPRSGDPMRIGAAVAAMVLAVVALAAQPAPKFKVRVEAVQIDTLVTSGGKPIAGLTATNFDLRDNGVRQRIERVEAEQVPLDVILALDASASVEGRPLQNLLAAARTTVGALRPGDRGKILSFSHRLSAPAPLTSDRAELLRAIDAVTAEGGTALFDAAFASLMVGGETGRRTLALIYTDGIDTISWLRPDDVIDSARRTDAVVYVVAAADSPELHFRVRLGSFNSTDDFLKELAATTGGSLLFAQKTEKLERVFSQIMDEFKNRYLISYYPEGVARGGWHTVEVTLKGRKGTVQARRGYHAD